jgi:two-component system cell cycle sensor histidine kinase/response regulator CckA
MAIVFMSGYAEDTFRRNDEKAEELHFLPKPFGLKQLAAKVKEVLSGTPPR